MKKLLALLFSCAILLCSCGTPQETASDQQDASAAKETTTSYSSEDEPRAYRVQGGKIVEVEPSLNDDEYPPAVFIQNGETVAEDPGYTVQASGISPYTGPPKSEPNDKGYTVQASGISPYGEDLSPEPETITVYVTNTGEKYHSAGCQYLRKSSIPMALENAKLSYSPCSKCYPPV